MVVQNPIILHDNARSHTAAVKDLLCRWQWNILEHPPYSPDMSPWDYDLFTKLKDPLQGIWYNTKDEFIQTYQLLSTFSPTRTLSRNAGLLVSYTNYLTPPQTTSAANFKLHTNSSSNPDTPPVTTSVNPPYSTLAPVALKV